MNFSLVFDNSGDYLPLKVSHNHELFEYFVEQANKKSQNSFNDDGELYRNVDKKITHLHWAVSKTNEVMYDLIDTSFNQHTDLENYLDQGYLNRLHRDWVFSHQHTINIDKLRFSQDLNKSKLGSMLHEMLPDEIRDINTAPAMEKIGYIFPYREVNLGVHNLENSFRNVEFKAENKWEVFDNPFQDRMITNNDIVNFSFGYTYVGRQYYNKFKFYDLDLSCDDHYNYEKLEFAFQLNLLNPETIPFSKESMAWAESKNIKLVAEQVPIGNIIDIQDKLFDYRKILYRNSKVGNSLTIKL